MPNLEEHCKRSLKLYGVEGRDIHTWLDEPSREYAAAHRQFRHDTETIRLVGEIFGKTYGKSLAENIALDHIMLDHEEEIKKHATIVVKLPEKEEIPTIPCGYCSTLLKPSDQFCPKCGASRTKIMEKLDRTLEMEKMKLREEKKKLKEELKLELKLKEMTPFARFSEWKRLGADPRIRSLVPAIAQRYAILEKLVQEDLRKDPELEKTYEIIAENQRKQMERVRAEKTGTRVVLFFLLILLPSIVLGTTVHVLIGILWFVFGIVFLLALTSS